MDINVKLGRGLEMFVSKIPSWAVTTISLMLGIGAFAVLLAYAYSLIAK